MASRARPTLIQRSRRVPPAEKAAFHDITGAGKGRVKRPFFGLTDSDADVITDRVRAALDKAVKA